MTLYQLDSISNPFLKKSAVKGSPIYSQANELRVHHGMAYCNNSVEYIPRIMHKVFTLL